MSGEQFWAGGVAGGVGVLVSVGLVVSVVPVISVVVSVISVVTLVVSAVVLVVSIALGDDPPVTRQEHADEMRDGILWHCDT